MTRTKDGFNLRIGPRTPLRGVVTVGAAELFGPTHAFGRVDLERITMAGAVENRRCRAIPERLGFSTWRTIEAAERLHEREVGHVVHAPGRSAWVGGDLRRP